MPEEYLKYAIDAMCNRMHQFALDKANQALPCQHCNRAFCKQCATIYMVTADVFCFTAQSKALFQKFCFYQQAAATCMI